MDLSCINIKFACNCDLTKLQENVSLKKQKRKENNNTVVIRPSTDQKRAVRQARWRWRSSSRRSEETQILHYKHVCIDSSDTDTHFPLKIISNACHRWHVRGWRFCECLILALKSFHILTSRGPQCCFKLSATPTISSTAILKNSPILELLGI